MRTLTLDTLTASHSSHEQYYDGDGTAWICTDLVGWRSAPGRRTQHTERPTADGAHRSAAYRDVRSYEIKGSLFPPTPELGEQAVRRLLALCRDPGELYPLTVQERDGALLTAMVEQAGAILTAQVGPLKWEFSVPLVANDPLRYTAWSTVAALTGAAGSGGIDFSGSGAVFTAPGLPMGTAQVAAMATVLGRGTENNLLVFEIDGPTSGVQIVDSGSSSIVGMRGITVAGQSTFINASDRVAYDVPGCPQPIPARGAVSGAMNARGGIWVAGGWPVLAPGDQRQFTMQGSAGSGSGLTVHTRGSYV
jgi:hypothetical protein